MKMWIHGHLCYTPWTNKWLDKDKSAGEQVAVHISMAGSQIKAQASKQGSCLLRCLAASKETVVGAS